MPPAAFAGRWGSRWGRADPADASTRGGALVRPLGARPPAPTPLLNPPPSHFPAPPAEKLPVHGGAFEVTSMKEVQV